MRATPDRANPRPYEGVFEHLDRSVIDTIEINPQLAATPLECRAAQYLNPEFIFQQAGIFTSGATSSYEESALYVMPETSTRAALLERFDQPVVIDGLAYSEVTAKGVGFGANIRWFEKSHLRRLAYNGNPVGLFGYNSAKEEMETGNIFAAQGIRTGRVAAILTLQPEKLKTWIQNNVTELAMREYLFTSLRIVEENGDKPAIVVRFTHPRYHDLTRLLGRRSHAREYPYTKEAILQSAIATYQAEINTYGGVDNYMQAYGIEDAQLCEVLHDIQKNSVRGRHIALRKLTRLDAYMDAFNVGRFGRLLLRDPGYRTGLKSYTMQDISLGAYWQDHEGAGNRIHIDDDSVESYIRTHLLNRAIQSNIPAIAQRDGRLLRTGFYNGLLPFTLQS